MTAVLQRFANVRRDEVIPILVAALYFFFILTALMILRPARDALGMQRGLDAVRWLFMGTLVVTLIANPFFAMLVSRYRRIVFIAAVYVFFAVSLLVFYGLIVLTPRAVGETSGQVFYVWMTVFNLFNTAVFWALMADRFTLEQSKRLYGVIAVGGTIGAIFGSWLASVLAEPMGAAAMLLLAAGFLMLGVVAAWALTVLQPSRGRQPGSESATAATDDGELNRAVIGGTAWDGMKAAFRSPYLMGVAGYILILTVVATFIYFTRLQMVEALGDDVDMRAAVLGRIDFYVQVATLLLQAFVLGHLMKRVGVAATLTVLPIVAALGFVGLAIVGTFAALIVFDAMFRAVQRAIARPARETLYTVVRREDKYKSKVFIDTFVYRGGDAIGAVAEGALGRLGMGLTALAGAVLPLALVWGALGIWLGRSQRRLARGEPVPATEHASALVAATRS